MWEFVFSKVAGWEPKKLELNFFLGAFQGLWPQISQKDSCFSRAHLSKVNFACSFNFFFGYIIVAWALLANELPVAPTLKLVSAIFLSNFYFFIK